MGQGQAAQGRLKKKAAPPQLPEEEAEPQDEKPSHRYSGVSEAEGIMTFKGLEYWVLAQVGLEVLLILLLLFSLLKIRSLGKLLKNSQKEEDTAIGNLEKLSDQLAAMETKRVALGGSPRAPQ
jgi:hypothetical protein